MKNFNSTKKMNLKTFLVTLAFVGFSMSVMAQTTYVITGSGTQFSATKGSTAVSTNRPIQSVINDIKADASRTACTIQFGNGTNTLNTGENNITFDGGSSGTDWGIITLTGKLTSACNGYNKGPIYLNNGVSLNSKAEITGTAGGDFGVTIYSNTKGTLTVSAGRILSTSATSAGAIYNTSTGNVNITGGTVEATGTNQGSAILTSSKAKVSVSGNAVVTSVNTNSLFMGTICITDGGVSNVCLEITGGTVENTATSATAICNYSTGAVNISGGTVTSNGDVIRIHGANSTIKISGGTVSTKADVGSAIYIANASSGTTLEVSNGTISASGTDWSHGICIGDLAGGNSTIKVNGGIIKSSGKYGTIHIKNTATNLTVTNGTVSATNGTAIFSLGSTAISGGMLLAQKGYAIDNQGTTSVNITGGIGFAHGTAVTDVINGLFTVQPVNTAVLVAWNKAAGTTAYTSSSTKDIYKLPAAATAVWARKGSENGISVANGAVTGFIPVAGITVDGVTGIPEVTNNQLKIYLNPSSGELWVSSKESQVKNIQIFDIYGKMLLHLPSPASQETVIDISHFARGIYFVKANISTGTVTQKILKR